MTSLVMQAAKGKAYGAAIRSLARVGGQCRHLWNLFTALNNKRIKAEGKFIFYTEMSAMLPHLLKADPKLSGLSHRAAQMTAKNFDRTLQTYIERKAEFLAIDARRKARSAARVARGLPPLTLKKAGMPQFKSRNDKQDGFAFAAGQIEGQPGPVSRNGKPRGVDALLVLRQSTSGGDATTPRDVLRIRLPKIGWVRIRGMRLPALASIKQVGVTQQLAGWQVSVQFEAPAKVYAVPTMPAVGIDVGLTALVDVGGQKVEPPRFARKAAKRIRWLNRQRDRRRKGSVNRLRTVVRLGKAHRAIRNRRHDHLHKLTRSLVDTYEGFAVEDLSLKGLMLTRLAKSFADASLGELLRQLRYKAEWACRSWAVMPRFCRSTGVCPDPACAWVGPRLRPGIGRWTCDRCGTEHDRDTAASQVILRDATAVRAAGVGHAVPEPASAPRRKRGSAVRGGDRASARSSSHGGPPTNKAVARTASRFE